jgi:hypothetical protein
MESTGLLTICLSAFLAVFVILSVLAIFMRLMMVIFPVKEMKEDAAVIAALTSVVNKFNPGKKITKIEEVK